MHHRSEQRLVGNIIPLRFGLDLNQIQLIALLAVFPKLLRYNSKPKPVELATS